MTGPKTLPMTVPDAPAAAQERADDFDSVLARLCASSQRHYTNPYEVAWPDTVDPTAWYTSPELISVYGTPQWDALDQEQRTALSFWEAVNFYSINIHGEKSLMEGVSNRLYDPDRTAEAAYLHHILDEENKHSIYFGGFCTRYAGGVYPSRTVALGTDPENAADFLFFARVLIFEEIVDRYNVVMARDPRLHPVARFINHNHHQEETRHLAFGRRMVARLFAEGQAVWSPRERQELGGYLEAYLEQTWREFYNPRAYLDAGLDRPWELARETWSSPRAVQHRDAVSKRCRKFLTTTGILPASARTDAA